jgi:hypothetical protein
MLNYKFRINFMGKSYVLPYREIKRHASVATNNRHYCNSCFCCACVDKLRHINEIKKTD